MDECGLQIARREHGVTVSYSFLKHTLQAAGLVKKQRARGRHRRRREPRACFGELLHIDGSLHARLALRPTVRAVLIAVVDDATKRVLYAQLWAGETTAAIMTALRDIITAVQPVEAAAAVDAKNASTAAWKRKKRVFHSSHPPDSSSTSFRFC
jgi:hypothetical protein